MSRYACQRLTLVWAVVSIVSIVSIVSAANALSKKKKYIRQKSYYFLLLSIVFFSTMVSAQHSSHSAKYSLPVFLWAAATKLYSPENRALPGPFKAKENLEIYAVSDSVLHITGQVPHGTGKTSCHLVIDTFEEKSWQCFGNDSHYTTVLLSSSQPARIGIFNNPGQQVLIYYGSVLPPELSADHLYRHARISIERKEHADEVKRVASERKEMLRIKFYVDHERLDEESRYIELQKIDGISPVVRKEIESGRSLDSNDEKSEEQDDEAGIRYLAIDNSLCAPEKNANCQEVLSSITSFGNPSGGGNSGSQNAGQSSGASSQGSHSVGTQTTPESVSSHDLTYTALSKRISDLKRTECSICMAPLSTGRVSKPPCGHVLHRQCMDGLISHGMDDRASCPTCRAYIDPQKINRYANWQRLKETLTQKCRKKFCDAVGSRDVIRSNPMRDCPYPMSTLTHREPNNFLEQNKYPLLFYLWHSFEESDFQVKRLWHESTHEGFTIHFEIYTCSCNRNQWKDCDHRTDGFIYQSSDIDGKENAEICLETLQKDHWTDKMIQAMRRHYPAIWDRNTHFFINLWNIYEDYFEFKEGNMKHRIKLSNVYDLTTKVFNWGHFRGELENKGLSYSKLFSTKKRVLSGCGTNLLGRVRGVYDGGTNLIGTVRGVYDEVDARPSEEEDDDDDVGADLPGGVWDLGDLGALGDMGGVRD